MLCRFRRLADYGLLIAKQSKKLYRIPARGAPFHKLVAELNIVVRDFLGEMIVGIISLKYACELDVMCCSKAYRVGA